MKSFKQFREECGCKDKERKSKSKKKTKDVEVMPNIPDGEKGMVTKVNNESVFAGNYQGPLYAPHPDLVKEVAPPGKKYERMVKHIKKGYAKDGKLSDDEKSIAYATAWKHKNKKESFEGGVAKARRDHRSGTLLTFKQFLSKLTDILDEWEK
tara:strand:+ start:90 stop:548 length:459 start_codon:yes stop_codon:yes gene_type:complete